MQEKNKKYAPIEDAVREKYVAEYQQAVVDQFRQEMIEEGFYLYKVVIQDVAFITSITDDELKRTAQLAIDILEELKEINNSGKDRKWYEQFVETEREKNDEIREMFELWNELKTDRLHLLIAECESVQRVGGAWALIIAGPLIINAICAVYEQIVDRFDDTKMYLICGFFLLRAIMKMRGDEVKE